MDKKNNVSLAKKPERCFLNALSKCADDGNIVLALIIAFSLIVGSVAILARAKGSLVGSLFSTQSRESREAAEFGMRYVVSELSKSPNRKLIVSGLSPSSWTSLSNVASIQNPCEPVSVPPTPTAKSFGSSTLFSVPSDPRKQFYLKSISFKSSASSGDRAFVAFSRPNASSAFTTSQPPSGSYSGSNVNLAGANRGYLELVVAGEFLINGNVISTSVITREFEVVPKCCQRSFGYTYQNPSTPVQDHGQDLRACPPIGFGDLSLVVGAGGNGTFSSNGKAFDLWESAINNEQEQAITLNPSDAKALNNPQGTQLVSSTQELPPQPASPVLANSACIQTSVILPQDGLSAGGSGGCTTSTISTNQQVWQLMGSATGGSVKSCKTPQVIGSSLTSNAILVDINLVNLSFQSPNNTKCYLQTPRQSTATTPYCISGPNLSEYSCSIRFVDSGGTVTIDSSLGKVNLFFYDATNTNLSGGRVATGGSVVFTGGGSGFVHLTGSPLASATLADATKLSVYNKLNNSTFNLKGASGALSGFFDLRYSNVTLSGGGSNTNVNLSGILWTNNLSLSGNLTLVNPASGQCGSQPYPAGSTCAILASAYPSLFDNDPTNDQIRPGYDWIPRSIFSLRMF